ncbi:MAG: malectin domain-containing carbohydrate-binding protein [Bacteroidia bacterium]|nr:malectin domain-containing carbohydrate-binding protein [Bacteroidia bacterium]
MTKFHSLFTLAFLLLASSVQASLPVVINNGHYTGCLSGGATYIKGGEIANTSYDSYYVSECYYASTTTLSVTDAAIISGNTYSVYLHFAEIWFGAGNSAFGEGDGARVFHVDVEGNRILTNFDIHAAVGPRKALAVKYDVMALSDGKIDILFTQVTQNIKISAIEVHIQGEASSISPDNGVYDLNASPFPVEWAAMKADRDGDRAVLNWQTAWESNNVGFEIQMNASGHSFKTIGFVEGVGTTQQASDYHFTTESLQPGRYVFRLKQIDIDGQVSISPSLEVAIDADGEKHLLPMSPNPATNITEVSFQTSGDEHISITLRNIVGQTLETIYEGSSSKPGIHRQSVDLSSLTPGIYLVCLYSNGITEAKRLVVTGR